MRTSFLRCATKGFFFPFLLFACLITAEAATNKKPVLISQTSSTRAIAFESVSFKAEPFPLTATIPMGSDTRTRICIFAMDLELLPGEGGNAFTSDVQDASGKLYPLRVEYVGQVPNFPGCLLYTSDAADE